MKNSLLFIYSTNILVRLLTINMKNGLTPKNSILCDPIIVTLLKMRPHYSHSSHQNATPPSGTSPLATYKEVTPPPPRIISNPWQNYILDSMLWILDSRNWISDSWSMDLGFRFSIVFYSRFWKLKIPKPWFPHSGFYWQEKITWILKGGGGLQENFLRPFGPQFGLRIRGGGLPGPLPWIRHCTGRSPAFDWDKTEHYSIPLRELPIYPSPKPTLTLASHLGHVGLGEG